MKQRQRIKKKNEGTKATENNITNLLGTMSGRETPVGKLVQNSLKRMTLRRKKIMNGLG
jgi:hypothetical protein